MKSNPISNFENSESETKGANIITLQRAKEIMKEEEIDYTDDELREVLHFVASVITITTTHYERTKQTEAKIISINQNTTHETTSHSLHPREHRRAS